MSTSFTLRAPRQAAILAMISALHVGVAVFVIAGVHPRLDRLKPLPSEIIMLPPSSKPPPVAPREARPIDHALPREPEPWVPFPDFGEAVTPLAEGHPATNQETGPRPGVPAPNIRAPALRTKNNRFGALVDACYPSSSRRLNEEGRVGVLVRIDATGRVTAWTITDRSGFVRLDAAVECVVRRLEFAPGRRDGEAVDASAMLPIVFRLR